MISAGDPVGTVNGKVVRTPIEGLVITIPPAVLPPKITLPISIGVRFDKPKPERHEPRLKAIW